MSTFTRAPRLGLYTALGYRFAVDVDDPELAGAVDEALATLRGDGRSGPRGCYRIPGARERYGLFHDGRVLLRAGSSARALATLMWHVNQQAVASATPGHLVLHAAAAVRDGAALLLPGPVESGKTTLVAGLVAHGWRYLTDEAAAVALDSGMVCAYPKPLSIDPGAQELFPELRPAIASRVTPRTGQWQVSASAIRADAVGEPAPLAGVVFPRYVRAAPTELRPVPRAAALARLADCAFAWQPPYGPMFRRTAEWLRASRCAELVAGDLAAACAAVDAFWEAP